MSGRRLTEGEEIVARLGPHPRALLGPIVALLLVVAAAAYLWGVLPERWMADVAAGIGVLVLVVGALPPVLRWAGTRYLLTTRRLIVASGVLGRSRRELLLARVGEVAVRRRGFAALWGCGDVLVHSAGDPLVLGDVARPRLVQAAILELVEARVGAGASDDEDEWGDGDEDDTGGWEDVHEPDR
ncbi:MAG: PH domain-containing protein [Actinomycetales bacterium]|nr:PH domain-containing protein [Actinomycetales bacterium]